MSPPTAWSRRLTFSATATSVGRWGLRFWFAPHDARSLRLFRQALALSFALYSAAWFLNADESLTDAGYHYSAETVKVTQPAPLPTLPGWAVAPFAIVLFGTALSQIVLWRERRTIWVVLACAVYTQLVDLAAAFTINKLFIVGFLVIALAPETEPEPGMPEGAHSAWPVRVLQATLVIMYFGAGLAKAIYGDWLADPNVLWSQVQGGYRTEFAAFLLGALPKPMWSVAMYSGLAFELLAPVLLMIRRLRWVGIVWGALFQLLIAALMAKLIFFSLQVLAFYLLFLDPPLLSRLSGICRRSIPVETERQR